MPTALKKKKDIAPIKEMRARLSKAGLKPTFLNEAILPDWWDDSIADTEGGLFEAAGIISSRTGFSLDELLQPGAALTLATPSGVKFKKSANKTETDVALVTQMARRVALVAVRAMDGHPIGDIPEPQQWRQELLKLSDRPWVCLRHLIEATWALGIPIVHLNQFPPNARKPDAFAMIIDGRPVIVICSQRKTPSWIAFTLAHELGHIFHGHLKDGEMLVDADIQSASDEGEEFEANSFARNLLTGQADISPRFPGQLTVKRLARFCEDFGKRYRVAPGVALLQWAFLDRDSWPLAMKALATLEGGDNAIDELHGAVRTKVPRESLSSDQHEWFISQVG